MKRLTKWKEEFMFWKREDLDQTFVTTVNLSLNQGVKKSCTYKAHTYLWMQYLWFKTEKQRGTCEMWICSMCTYRHKRLSEWVESNCKNKHTKNTIIKHSKMDRENYLKVSSTNYFSEAIWSKKSLEQTLDEHFLCFWSYPFFSFFLYL